MKQKDEPYYTKSNPRGAFNVAEEKFILETLNNESDNIIKYYSDEESENKNQLKIEKCDYTLEKIKRIYNNKNRVIPERIVLHFISQIIQGLEFMNRKGVIHNDIKMENIMISYKKTKIPIIKSIDFENLLMQATCKIIDYDLSKKIKFDENEDPFDCSEMKYKRVDLYSVGLVMYFLLTLHQPSSTQSDIEFNENEKISKTSILLLRQLLKANPSRRITAKEALKFIEENKEKLELIDFGTIKEKFIRVNNGVKYLRLPLTQETSLFKYNLVQEHQYKESFIKQTITK